MIDARKKKAFRVFVVPLADIVRLSARLKRLPHDPSAVLAFMKLNEEEQWL